MGREETQSDRAAPRVLNPLWIISLFLGISETTVGIAATQATGWVQGLLAVSATVFPFLVSGAFFATIWRKPEVLYAPGDFPEHIPVPDFVQGIHRNANRDLEHISSVMRETLESVLPIVLEPQLPKGTLEEVVSEAVAIAQTDLESRTLRIDLRLIDPGLGHVEQFIGSTTTVSDLLDSLWAELRTHVPPYSYGEQWVLVDRQTLRPFDHMGRQWAQARNPDVDPDDAVDSRLLEQVGITPGMELAAVPKTPPAYGHQSAMMIPRMQALALRYQADSKEW